MSKELTYEVDEDGVFIEDEAHEMATANLIGLLEQVGVFEGIEEDFYD